MQTARTTIEIDKDLLRQVKQRAIEEDKTLRELITEALAKAVRHPWQKKAGRKIRIRTYNMGEIKGTLSREEIYDWL